MPMPTLLHHRHDDPALDERLTRPHGDAVLLEWNGTPAGLFARMDAARRAQRVILPARWLPVRRPDESGLGDDGRLLWMARGDAALARLLGESGGDPLAVEGLARPDEPLALLGAPGDVLGELRSSDPAQLRERAESWIQKLGVDRVAIALPFGADEFHPLAELARERMIPVVQLLGADDPAVDTLPCGTQQTPLLWTDFQLDGEHRLPDESYVPGLRDLLHRGSLLRERALYERLPEGWHEQAEAELRALYAWHVSPLLRRAAALLQTLQPVAGVKVEAPLPELEGVCAWLLGLSHLRPAEDPRALPDPVAAARALATALHEWDRRLWATVKPSASSRVRARLAPWAEGGHLALCSAKELGSVQRFCFSGQPLWTRVPLRRAEDGIPRISLDRADRRALGWFELELALEAGSLDGSGAAEGRRAAVELFPQAPSAHQEQLPLELEGSGA